MPTGGNTCADVMRHALPGPKLGTSRAVAPKGSYLVRGRKDVFGQVWKMALALGA